MAKFNKDTFLNDITGKVQSAIDKNLITSDDIKNKDEERLHGFIQYELLEYIEDRKFALDVLKDFNYDEKAAWSDIQDHFGVFNSLMDIALVNLWKFLDVEGATQYDYYNTSSYNPDTPMLDLIRDREELPPYSEDDSESNDSLFNVKQKPIGRRISNRDFEDEPEEEIEEPEEDTFTKPKSQIRLRQ